MKIYSSKIISAVLACAMLGTLGGCKKAANEAAAPTSTPEATSDVTVEVTTPEEEVTVESLLNGVKGRQSEAGGIEYNNTIEMSMDLSMFDETVTSTLTGEGFSRFDGENTYAKTTMTTVTEDETTSEETEIYYIKDGDSYTKYELTGGKWTKTATDSNGGINLDELADEVDTSTATLETTDDEYVIVTSLEYEDVNGAVQTNGTVEAAEEPENVTVPAEFHFDKETKELKSIVIKLDEIMNEYFKKAFDESIAEKVKEEGIENAEEMVSGFALHLSALNVIMSDFKFGPQEITLPEEAANAEEVTAEAAQ